MTVVELTADALDAAGQVLPANGPISMVNLVRYRAHAEYGDGPEFPPCTGREAYYQRYVPAFGKVPGAEQTTVSWLGNVRATLVAPDGEAWDDVVIVEYPSFAVMRGILESAQYQTDAAPHRRAALRDWRFVATTKAEVPTRA